MIILTLKLYLSIDIVNTVKNMILYKDGYIKLLKLYLYIFIVNTGKMITLQYKDDYIKHLKLYLA